MTEQFYKLCTPSISSNEDILPPSDFSELAQLVRTETVDYEEFEEEEIALNTLQCFSDDADTLSQQHNILTLKISKNTLFYA